MKKILTATGSAAGLIYGGAAAMLAYPDSPFALQGFIIIGVGAVGASAGWLLGLLASIILPRRSRPQ